MKITRLSILLLIFAIFTPSCSGEPKAPSVEQSKKLRNPLAKSLEIFVYEGLPHQSFEPAQLKSEKKRKDVTILGKFPFYTPPAKPGNDHLSILKTLLSSDQSIEVFSGEKRCGGFHPDYAVSWSIKNEQHIALVCFGCSEVIFLSESKQYRYDLKAKTRKSLQEILSQFQKKRPLQKLDTPKN